MRRRISRRNGSRPAGFPYSRKPPPTPVRDKISPNGRACPRDLKQELTMPEESEPLVLLAGSERAPLPGVAPAGQLNTSERAELTLVLRRRAASSSGIVE